MPKDLIVMLASALLAAALAGGTARADERMFREKVAPIFERHCVACHQGAEGKGGFSGPELTDGGARLQPDFIAAYTADPQKFDPHIWMPSLNLKDKDIQRLTAYVLSLGGKP